jgi:putative endopeptidase
MTDSVSASGINQGELDPEVRPQDDLFRHVNGKWIARSEIPADKARWGSFTLLAEESEMAVRDIILESQAAAGSQERKVGDLYASFLDEERIEALGATPLAADLATVDTITSIPELLGTLGRLERAGVSGAFGLFVDNDPGNPERYLVMLQQGGLSLPDESYYRDEKFADIRVAYLAFLERMFTLSGLDDAPGRAQRVFDLETELATHHWDKVASRDSEKSYNLRTWGQVSALAAGADLDLWLDALGVPAGSFDEVVVRQPSFIAGLAESLTEDALDSWTDWLRWQIIRSSSSYLSGEFRHPAAARALEARRLAGRVRARRGRGPHLRGAPLQADREGEHGRARRPPRRGVRAEHPRARLDDRGDPRPRAGEARQVHPEDRLPGQVARLLKHRDRARQPARQRAGHQRLRVPP